MLFGKKRTPPPPSPAWLRWLLIVFVGAALVYGTRDGTLKLPGRSNSPLPQGSSDNLSTGSEPFDYSSIKNRLLPGAGALSIKTSTDGKGAPIICGQQATIAYESYIQGQMVDSATKEKPLTFRMGEGLIVPALELGVTGMRPGGTRTLIAPAGMGYSGAFAREGIPVDTTAFKIELLSTSPAAPDFETTPYRIAIIQHGMGSGLLCGQTATINMTIWGIDGKKLFSTLDEGNHPITVTPGKSELFLGLEHGIIGISRGGRRTLVVPPAFQKPLRNTAPVITFPFPESQTVLVDVEALP